MTTESPAALAARIDAALRARARRPLRDVAAALAAAAVQWRNDPDLAAELPAVARLSPQMIAAVIPLAAEALDGEAMLALVERELGAGAADRPAPAGPGLVAHVLASNVPALALPAIALGCLAGAAVVVKSGRGDPLSAPAFRRALAAIDPDLAATVVTTYWPGGERPNEDVVLARADVVVVTGGDAAIAALAARVRGRLIAHGPRLSVAAVTDGDAVAENVALDIALHDQRGCLSPHAVYVDGDARAFAGRLAAALDALGARLPVGPASIEERAAARAARDDDDWAGAEVRTGPGGTVAYDPRPMFRPTGGRRTVRVHPHVPLAKALPAGRIECVGVAGRVETAALVRLGVARVCPVGRMQRPPLSWPRGQRGPLRSLLGTDEPPRCEVEA